jgi:hypothetical protein
MDSIVVECIGADSLHLTAGAKDARFDLDLFPHDHWKFRARLYANGALMQKGEVEMKLEAGTTVDISIPMHALVGFVYVEIPLGFGNPAGVASGTLTLASAQGTFTYPMETDGPNATFRSEMIPLGYDYAVTLSLMDSAGVAMYSISDTIRIDENSPVPELAINSLRAKTKIALQIADDVELQIPLTLPATRRKVKEGDLVISEFLVNSKNDSSAYDFIEVYNGSNDTLLIEDCFIGKTSALKESAANGDPPHWLCPQCLGNGVKSFVQASSPDGFPIDEPGDIELKCLHCGMSAPVTRAVFDATWRYA